MGKIAAIDVQTSSFTYLVQVTHANNATSLAWQRSSPSPAILFVFLLRVCRRSLPVNLLERLRGTPARLDERTRDLPAERLTRVQSGRWSAQENVGHLLDLEPLWLRRAKQYFAGSTTSRSLSPSTMTIISRSSVH